MFSFAQNESGTREAAQQYNAQGWATVAAREKKPCYKGWQDESPNVLKDFSDIKKQFLIVLKDTDLVIDIDPRHFAIDPKTGKPINSWRALKETLHLPAESVSTTIVETPSGGYHLYFTKPGNIKALHTIKKFPGLEFKSKGRYVLGAGSWSADGQRQYNFVSPDKTQSEPSCAAGTRPATSYILPCPKELLDFLTKKEPAITINPAVEYFDSPINVDRYTGYLQHEAPAVQGAGGDNSTFIAACRGRDFGLSPEKTYELMSQVYNPRCAPMWDTDELLSKVNNAYAYNTEPQGRFSVEKMIAALEEQRPLDDDSIKLSYANQVMDRTENGKEKPTLKNCVIYCQAFGEISQNIRYNQFTHTIEIGVGIPWKEVRHTPEFDDADVTHLAYYLACRTNVQFGADIIYQTMTLIARLRTYHPIKNYLASLVWDQKPRIDTFLTDIFHVKDEPYSRAAGRCTLMAAVQRILMPGCKQDTVLILEGAKGIRKSTAVSILGGAWAGDINIDAMSKDTVDAMRGRWIIECAEMTMLANNAIGALKGFITRQVDRCRMAYERTTKDYPRQCIFIGTINPEEVGYLKEESGDRRYVMVFCNGRIDTERLIQERDQLFAEAYFRVKRGEDAYITDPEVQEQAFSETMKRVIADPYDEIIGEWLLANPKAKEITTSLIFRQVLGANLKDCSRGDQMRIGKILRRYGYERKFVNRSYHTGSLYVRKEDEKTEEL